MSRDKVNIRRLKNFVLKSFPKGKVLRDLVLSENDVLNSSEFCVKVDIWLKLARGDITNKNSGGSG